MKTMLTILAIAFPVAIIAIPAQASVPTGDFDGDGRSDVFWRNVSTGANSIWKSANIMAGSLLLANSTVAYNNATSGEPTWGQGGLWAGTSIQVESSIVSNNTSLGQPSIDLIVSYRQPFTGSDNIIGRVRSFGTGAPTDTMWGVDPMLLPLADNGGRTLTHALAAGSPAIDRGNNEADLTDDQRGHGFPRTKGACTDIGAFER